MHHQAPPDFQVKLASSKAEVRAAQRLRYDVFVDELGGGGPMVDHAARLEQDAFDPFMDHLLLFDRAGDNVIGVYRLLRPEMATAAGGYYSASEYDLTPLHQTGRRLLELGRSCLHPAYRGGTAMQHLWHALARYVAKHRIDLLFGVASFHGTNVHDLANPLSLLHHRYLAPPHLRVKAHKDHYQSMDLISEGNLDRKAGILAVPSLIKAYLRLGGYVGKGAFVDHDFNTTDVCLIMDTKRLVERRMRLALDRAL
ncbi:MAG: GNAT family N-acyltransferase [Pseudomonadota bacterium]